MNYQVIWLLFGGLDILPMQCSWALLQLFSSFFQRLSYIFPEVVSESDTAETAEMGCHHPLKNCEWFFSYVD